MSCWFKKWNRALNCSSLNFFYLSIVEIIQNERKANFVTLYDRNLSSKRVHYVNNVGSINDSRINVQKCTRCNGLNLWSTNTMRSMHCNTAAQNRGQWLNQSHFRSMVEVSFPSSVNIRRASASREGTNILNQRIYSDFFVLSVVFVNFALKVIRKIFSNLLLYFLVFCGLLKFQVV